MLEFFSIQLCFVACKVNVVAKNVLTSKSRPVATGGHSPQKFLLCPSKFSCSQKN